MVEVGALKPLIALGLIAVIVHPEYACVVLQALLDPAETARDIQDRLRAGLVQYARNGLPVRLGGILFAHRGARVSAAPCGVNLCTVAQQVPGETRNASRRSDTTCHPR